MFFVYFFLCFFAFSYLIFLFLFKEEKNLHLQTMGAVVLAFAFYAISLIPSLSLFSAKLIRIFAFLFGYLSTASGMNAQLAGFNHRKLRIIRYLAIFLVSAFFDMYLGAEKKIVFVNFGLMIVLSEAFFFLIVDNFFWHSIFTGLMSTLFLAMSISGLTNYTGIYYQVFCVVVLFVNVFVLAMGVKEYSKKKSVQYSKMINRMRKKDG